ncbi:DUF7210 family protein [Serratia fonticola]|uniref:DUF7210 family protein n=1 Tax=Serratia fonticola TaxID=47917 RepID=UPI003AFFBBDA
MAEKVVFIKGHTHAGKFYPVDGSTSVTPAEAEWLHARGIIAPKAPGKSKPAITEPEQGNTHDQ